MRTSLFPAALVAVLAFGCKGKPIFTENSPVTPVTEALVGRAGTPPMKFTMSLPEGLSRRINDGTVSFEQIKGMGVVLSVFVSISHTVPETLAKSVADMKKEGRTIKLEKERNPGDPMPDWTAVGVHSKSVRFASMRRTGPFALQCSGFLNVENASDALVAWAGNLCDSVTPEVPGLSGAEASAATRATTGASARAEAPMSEFLAALDGKAKSVSAALKKYGASKLDSRGMDRWDLQKPSIVKSSTLDGKPCYEMHAKSGITVRAYNLCVASGKIQQVTPLGDDGLLPPGSE